MNPEPLDQIKHRRHSHLFILSIYQEFMDIKRIMRKTWLVKLGKPQTNWQTSSSASQSIA